MSSGGNKMRSLWWLFVSLSRGLAAFLAAYSLLSLSAAIINGLYNQNAWWIDFGVLLSPLDAIVQVLLTVALGFFAVHVPQHRATRIIVALPLLLGLITAILNTATVYRAALEGTIILGFPLPFSFFVSVGLLCILISALFGAPSLSKSRRAMQAAAKGELRGATQWAAELEVEANEEANAVQFSRSTPRAHVPQRAKTVVAMSVSFVIAVVLFPLGQMHCFGTTNYRVPVDAAVVLGAHVFADGTPSRVLQDRLDTAIQFYEEGYTPVLVMSGGIDADGTSEAKAMQVYAVEHGVATEDIIIDEQGSNTKQTARNTVDTLRAAGMIKIATVSNFYHLARIKMLYLAEGMDVVTVPSVATKDPGYPLLNVAREIPGWWYYWFGNLIE